MESRKKPTSDLPKWERILAKARNETPPRIDVRPGVRSLLESQLRSGITYEERSEYGILESVLELFSRPVARLSLGAAAVCVFGFTATLASMIDASELEESLDAGEETPLVFDESYVVQDLTEIL